MNNILKKMFSSYLPIVWAPKSVIVSLPVNPKSFLKKSTVILPFPTAFDKNIFLEHMYILLIWINNFVY